MIIQIGERSRQLLNSSNITTILQVPRMTDAEYDEIKYIVEYVGGHWRERYKGFIFDESLEIVRVKISNILKEGKFKLSDNIIFKIKNQFYPTPDWLAKLMVERAEITKSDYVLEPSAGRAAILKYIANSTKHYYAVEYNKQNAEHLRQLGYRVNNTSFENYCTREVKQFDKIVMNPPFANKMDIKHTVLAYNMLKPGGKLISLMAENSIYYDRPITHRFQNFIATHNGIIEEIPHGTFKESGTNVDVVMITLNKLKAETIDITDWD